MSYNTISRTQINKFLSENKDRTVTVSDISEYLKDNGIEVNVTTIYRYLDKLVSEEQVIKYVAEKGKQAAFQYIEHGHKCDEHLHLQCVRCGGISHLECEFMDEIAEHIKKDHGFELQCKGSIIYGVCEKCNSSERC